MLKLFTGIAIAITLLWGLPYAHGQKATEIFIPIGKSPGLSEEHTIIGTIDKINAQDQTVAITDSLGSVIVKVSDYTKIYLDKSKLKLSNQIGSLADCRKDLLVEVKYQESERKNTITAEWIKVQLTE